MESVWAHTHLLLSTTELDSSLADLGIILFLKALDEIMRVRQLGCVLDVFIRCLIVAVRNIVFYGSEEKNWILLNDTDLAPMR